MYRSKSARCLTVAATRRKYREPEESAIPQPNNIMYDKRVVRGNTYAAQILPATAQAEQLELERKAQMASAKRSPLV